MFMGLTRSKHFPIRIVQTANIRIREHRYVIHVVVPVLVVSFTCINKSLYISVFAFCILRLVNDTLDI